MYMGLSVRIEPQIQNILVILMMMNLSSCRMFKRDRLQRVEEDRVKDEMNDAFLPFFRTSCIQRFDHFHHESKHSLWEWTSGENCMLQTLSSGVQMVQRME